MLDIKSERELEFVLFCVDFVARALNVPPTDIYQKLLDSGLLQSYIIDCYDSLHTQGKAYLVENIIQLMKERGLL